MRSLAIGFTVLIMVICTKMEEFNDVAYTNILDDILVYPIPVPEIVVKKREALQYSSENFTDFLVEKLTHHTRALEKLIKNANRQEEITRQLTEKLSKVLEKPNLPTIIESKEPNTRRSNSYHEVHENPILRLGKNIPIYGRLAKDLFMEEVQSVTDPTPLLEANPDEPNPEYSRRSFGGRPVIDSSQTDKNGPSPWCKEAFLCKKDAKPVCGFDDNFGYGKFDDLCHMLNVNCYYKYNFVLGYTCHPTI